MKSKKPDIQAYLKFLLRSELADGIKAEYYYREFLARALIEVLHEKGILDKQEVLLRADQLLNEELLDYIDPEELEQHPDRIPLKVDFTKLK